MKQFKSGKYISQGYYKSFQPEFINKQLQVDNMEILQLLSQADRELGRLDMYSKYIPNIELYISMHVLKEATQSSKIEGTQTNMDEALLEKEDLPLDKRDDWEEVQNYIKAMEWAVEHMDKLPLSSRLIRETHRVLLQGVRGEKKQPGEFRISQNWIGGATINDAVFIPPVHSSVTELMSDIEKFIHNEEIHIPELLKIGLVHYQFETVHPFLDGNGRIGRLIIPLYLVSKGILQQPVLYLSDFFEKNRKLYYDNLTTVREKNDLGQWYKFFLVGVIETAKNGIITFDNILQLQKQIDIDIQSLGSRALKAKKVIDYLYKRPMITAVKVSEIASISMPSSYKLISDLEKLNVLIEKTGGQRSRVYAFDNYLNLFR
ncbi:MAG: cell filamentation protein Fic [Bacteroidetes bacterium GWF2_41_31]|nr:MAG: cell filamentation protein Fic [Bacteroidetes bacterium GWF2_41_31]OFZ02741.1 MAG: cell filamentation protein Fic [Bacteroidetes bacterium RIFOXYB12_FULL_41_6]